MEPVHNWRILRTVLLMSTRTAESLSGMNFIAGPYYINICLIYIYIFFNPGIKKRVYLFDSCVCLFVALQPLNKRSDFDYSLFFHDAGANPSL